MLVCACTAYKSEYGYEDSHSVELPIKSYHDVKVIPSPSYIQKHKTQVVVKASDLPVYVTFNSQSSPVYVKQNHKGTRGSYHKSESKDEPHRLVHEVIKPVYQEVKEIIKPYRKVIQVIEPVREERLTKVHKSEGERGYGKGGYGGEGEDYGKKYESSYDDENKKYGMAKSYNDNDGYKIATKYEDGNSGSYKKYDQDDDGYVKMEYKKNDDGDLYKVGSMDRYFKVVHNNRYDSNVNDQVTYGKSSNGKFRGMLDGF